MYICVCVYGYWEELYLPKLVTIALPALGSTSLLWRTFDSSCPLWKGPCDFGLVLENHGNHWKQSCKDIMFQFSSCCLRPTSKWSYNYYSEIMGNFGKYTWKELNWENTRTSMDKFVKDPSMNIMFEEIHIWMEWCEQIYV